MARYFEKTPPPDFGFAPDGDFPVINGEKGILVFDIAKKFAAAREYGLVLRSVTGGNAPNSVPDQCRAIFIYEDEQNAKEGRAKKRGSKAKTGSKDTASRDRAFEMVRKGASDFRERTGAKISCKGAGNALEVFTRGVSAHGSTPEKGENAISVMMDFIGTLPVANESARDFVDFYNASIGNETDGKSLGVSMSDEPSGPLIVNIGMIDLRREAVMLTINIRYPVTKTEDEVYAALTPALDANGLGFVKSHMHAPLYFKPDDPFIELFMDVYRENTGDTESKPIVYGGGTYARSIPKAVAFGPCFPGEDEVMHQKNEYISLESLMKAAHIYADAIMRLSRAG